jgi:nicotinamide-nucleotide amidase
MKQDLKLFEDAVLQDIRGILLEQKKTVSVAESVTSGLLQFAFSNTMDTIRFFEGGITVYNPNQKFRLLNVEPTHALAVNCVSEKVALELANNVRNKFSSDYGIGITGYASEVPESDFKLFAFYSIVDKDREIAAGRMNAEPSEGIGVQLYYVSEILRNFLAALRA